MDFLLELAVIRSSLEIHYGGISNFKKRLSNISLDNIKIINTWFFPIMSNRFSLGLSFSWH